MVQAYKICLLNIVMQSSIEKTYENVWQTIGKSQIFGYTFVVRLSLPFRSFFSLFLVIFFYSTADMRALSMHLSHIQNLKSSISSSHLKKKIFIHVLCHWRSEID